MTSNAASPEVAQAFLDFAFGNFDGTGLIEIAHSGNDGGAINRARLFPNTAEGRAEAARFAAERNAEPGVNLYFAPSLRLDTAPRGKRARKTDVLGSPLVWADFDDPGSPAAGRAAYNAKGMPPHRVVVTGRTPETRAQAFWLLDDLVTDQAQLDEMLAGLHVGLGFVADPKVVNADRVMRLPGCIAWPKPGKEGRIPELTELHVSQGAPSAPRSIADFVATFPRRDPVQARKGIDAEPGADLLSLPPQEPTAAPAPAASIPAAPPAPAAPAPGTSTPAAPPAAGHERAHDMLGRVIDGRDEHAMRILGGSIRNLAAALGRWPTPEELFADAWPTFERTAAPKMPRPGEQHADGLEREGRGRTWFAEKCRTHAARAMRGQIKGLETVEKAAEAARLNAAANIAQTAEAAKIGANGMAVAGALPPDNTAGFAITSRAPLRIEPGKFTAARFLGREVPPIEWLVEDLFGQGRAAVLAAIGGLGKSFLTLDLCVKVAAGPQFGVPQKWFGHSVLGEGSVVFLTAEDDENSVHRRLNAITDPEALARAAERLHVIPLPDNGGALPLVAGSRTGPTLTEHAIHLLEDAAKLPDLKLVVIDPLQAFCAADVNTDPAVAQTLWSAITQLSATTGASVLVLHHMRKDGIGDIRGLLQAREGIRGTSAIVDGARLALVMYPLDKERAESAAREMNIAPELGVFVAGGVAKSNDPTDGTEHFLVRGDNGLLVDRTGEVALAIQAAKSIAPQIIGEVFDEISKAEQSGQPFGIAHNAKRPLAKFLADLADVPEAVAKSYVRSWNEAGCFETFTDPKTRRTGIRVVARPA